MEPLLIGCLAISMFLPYFFEFGPVILSPEMSSDPVRKVVYFGYVGLVL